MTTLSRDQVIEGWSSLAYKLPLICGINTYNNELTIYACLQQAVKNFHQIIIFDDGSTDKTFTYINKFIEDYNPKNLIVMSVDHLDPWPDQIIKKDHGVGEGVPMRKTHAKSKAKSFSIIKQNFPTALYISLEADVICCDNITTRIYERIAQWPDPFIDVEFFNMIMAIDSENLRAVSSSETEPIRMQGIKQRKIYDHPGDWTLACMATFGDLTVGPDPAYPYGACTLPWSQRIQCEKKGQDNSEPFGFHMLSYNNNELNIHYRDRLTYKISDVEDAVDFSILKKLWFPKVLKLDKDKQRYIEKEECVL